VLLGFNAVDKTLVAEAAHRALMKFDVHVVNNPVLTEIRFLDIDQNTIETFKSTFEHLNRPGGTPERRFRELRT